MVNPSQPKKSARFSPWRKEPNNFRDLEVNVEIRNRHATTDTGLAWVCRHSMLRELIAASVSDTCAALRYPVLKWMRELEVPTEQELFDFLQILVKLGCISMTRDGLWLLIEYPSLFAARDEYSTRREKMRQQREAAKQAKNGIGTGIGINPPKDPDSQGQDHRDNQTKIIRDSSGYHQTNAEGPGALEGPGPSASKVVDPLTIPFGGATEYIHSLVTDFKTNRRDLTDADLSFLDRFGLHLNNGQFELQPGVREEHPPENEVKNWTVG